MGADEVPMVLGSLRSRRDGTSWPSAITRPPQGSSACRLDRSFQILFIVIIGGLATIRGAFFGAAIIVVLPLLLSRLSAALLGAEVDSGVLDMIQRVILGVLIIAFLIAEPDGLAALVDRVVKGFADRLRIESPQ